MRPLAALVPLASLALALVAASTESTASADVCVFTQNCDASVFGPPCHPIAQTFAPTPFSDNSSTASPLQCPLYANSSCCNGHQNNALKFNFELIDGTFGSSAGGNGACVANIKDLWCAFTCAPDQGRFVDVNGYANMSSSGILYTVLLTTFHLDKNWACGIFESCKDTSIAELAGFASCEQFLSYQMTESISRGSYSNFLYTDPGASARALAMPLNDCCSYPDSLDNSSIPFNQATNVSTPCAYCSGMCGGQDVCYTTGKAGTSSGAGGSSNNSVVVPSGDALAEVDTSAFYGFDALPMFVIYGVVFFGSAAIVLWRWLAESWERRKGGKKVVVPKGRGTMVSMQPLGGSVNNNTGSYEPPTAAGPA